MSICSIVIIKILGLVFTLFALSMFGFQKLLRKENNNNNNNKENDFIIFFGLMKFKKIKYK